MKAGTSSQLELISPMKLVPQLQATMLHNMKVENPHPFTQFLAFIFHFFCYMNGWFSVSFHCLDYFVRPVTPFCPPAWMVMLWFCCTPRCVLSKPRPTVIQMLRVSNTELSGQLS